MQRSWVPDSKLRYDRKRSSFASFRDDSDYDAVLLKSNSSVVTVPAVRPGAV